MLTTLNNELYTENLTTVDRRAIGEGESTATTWTDWAFAPLRFEGMVKHQMASAVRAAFSNQHAAMPYVDDQPLDDPASGDMRRLQQQLTNIRTEATSKAYSSYKMVKLAMGDDLFDAAMAAVWVRGTPRVSHGAHSAPCYNAESDSQNHEIVKLPAPIRRLLRLRDPPPDSFDRAAQHAGHVPGPNTERGTRSTPENALKALYRRMWVDPELRATILDIRAMDRADSRVKKIHTRMSRTAVKGGLLLEAASSHKRLQKQWGEFRDRLGLTRQEKIESDCRGLVMEGNLPMQWMLNADQRVLAGIRMPTETLIAKVLPNGRFVDPAQAYEQYDLAHELPIASFALWQLSLVRLSPDNYDDMGCFGRPYLDASRTPWRKLIMTEEDLVIRRRHRAPLRMAHVLEGAGEADVEKYRAEVERDGAQITTDYYLNRKGGVTALQGDANLDQTKGVVLLRDAFFAGALAPKGLFGYTDGMARDILEDLKHDYYDEMDALQDTLSYVYELGFRLDLLLQGVNLSL